MTEDTFIESECVNYVVLFDQGTEMWLPKNGTNFILGMIYVYPQLGIGNKVTERAW